MIFLDLTLTWMAWHCGRTVSRSGPSLLTFFCLFPIHTLLQYKNKLCALFLCRTALCCDIDMPCLSNIHPCSINMKLLLSWQFPQAPQRDGHLLYAVLRCWFVRCHFLNIPCPVLAVCSGTEKGRREGFACLTQSLCQNAHYRHLPRNLRP